MKAPSKFSSNNLRDFAKAVEAERLRFEGDLDKWMKLIGAGITGYQPEAYAVMDHALEELVRLRAAEPTSPGITLTDWERVKILQAASASALTYMGHHARGGLKPHEVEEMGRWEQLCEKLRHAPHEPVAVLEDREP